MAMPRKPRKPPSLLQPDSPTARRLRVLALVALIVAVGCGFYLKMLLEATPAGSDRVQESCNMRILDGVSAADLIAILSSSQEPVLVRNSWTGTSFADFEEHHGAVRVKVVSGHQVTNHESPPTYETSVREYAEGVRSGRIPNHDYVFTNVGSTSIATGMPELGDTFAGIVCRHASGMPPSEMQHAQCASRMVSRGVLSLLYGGTGSGNGFHEHGPALNILLAGEKRWVVKRPNASLTDAKMAALLSAHAEHERDEARAHGWAQHVWRCEQRIGDFVWVPNFLSHATSNAGPQTVALTTLLDTTSLYHEAIYRGSAAEVQAMLETGARVDATERGRPPLHLVGRGPGTDAEKLEKVLLLLAAGVSVNARDGDGQGPCHTFTRSAQTVQALVDAGAAVNVKDNHRGGTALHLAAWEGQVETVRVLLRAGAAADLTDHRGATALILLLANGGHGREAEGVRALLEGGASTEIEDRDWRGAPYNALHVAVMKGYAEAAQALLEGGASVDAPDREGLSALHHAARAGHVEAVRVLMAAGARTDVRNADGLTPRQLAEQHGQLAAGKMLSGSS